MSKIVQVPGVGNVEFPDSMSDDQIGAAIQKQVGAPKAPAQEQPEGFWSSAYNTLVGGIKSGIQEFINRPNEIRKATDALGVYQKIEDDSASLPENKGKPRSQWKLRDATPDEQKTIDAGMNANLPTGQGNMLTEQTAPYVAAAQQAAKGNLAGAAGTVAGAVAPMAVGGAISRFAPEVPIVPKVASTLDPTETAAVQFAQSRGIPVNPGTATGNPVLQNLQGFLANAPGASRVMKKAAQSQTQLLKNVGADLMADISPAETTPEISGTGVRQALESRQASQSGLASGAYERLERIEGLPANQKTVTVGQRASNVLDANGNPVTTPIMKSIALPTDFTQLKQTLRPIADQIRQQLPVGQQQYSKGLTAIQNILDGPDVVPASVAEQNLGALKSIQRDAVNAKTKWLASQAIKEYAPVVEQSVAQAGPEAIDALRQGRQMTAAKYATQATIDQLPTEPVQLFNKLTSAKDANINLLRDVSSKSPEAMPAVGRAVVEGLVEKAFAEAGTAKPGAALTEWNKLGDQTKRLLFQNDPRTIQNLDNFFTYAKKAAEEPNPSRSAYVAQLALDGSLLWHSPHGGAAYLIGKNALARLLTNPTTANAITNGLTLPTSRAAMAGVITNQVLRAAPEAKQINAPDASVPAWGALSPAGASYQ